MSPADLVIHSNELVHPPLVKLSDKSTDDQSIEKEEHLAITIVSTAELRERISDSEVQNRPAVLRHSRTQLAIIIASLYFSVFLAALDSTITTTALPTITQHFNSSTGYTWIGSAYLLGMAASTPSWGKVSDIWGRRPIMLYAVAVFLLGSLFCGVAVNMAMLIVGRAIQGIGAGGILTLVNICQGDLFSMKTRVLIFASESLIWAAAAALGPLLGGAFSELVSWRWCFYINLPAGGLAFILLMFYLTLQTPSTPLLAGLKAVDWIGSFTIVGATISILLGLELGGVIFPWDSAKVLCLIIFGFVMIAIFLYNEEKLARYPIMPLHLFKERSNIAALSVGFFHSLTYLAATYYMPLYTQAVRGYTPLQSGISLLPFAIALPISAALTGIIIQRTSRYVELIWFGLSIMTIGFGSFISLTPNSTDTQIILFQILAGAGSGIAYSSPLIALQTLISPDDNATATATYGFLRYLATAISVVLGGVIFQNEMESHAPRLQDVLGLEVAKLLSGREAAANVLVIKTLDTEIKRELAKWAFSRSLRSMWIFYTCTGAAGLVASFWIRKRVLSGVFQEVRTGLENEELKRKGERRGPQS